jgi:uncharacterized protein (DUF952 family)
MDKNFYKVLKVSEWEHFNSSELIITDLDKKDGFVHLSLASQLFITLMLYFKTEDRVVLLQLKHIKIQHKLRFELSLSPDERGGRFPHYYGDLNLDAVSKVWYLDRGAFEIPLEILFEVEDNSNSEALL